MEYVHPTGERHHSPIWVSRVAPKKRGKGLLRIEFYHANYPEGVRDKGYDLKVLHRDIGYLLAMRVDEKQKPLGTMILETATLEWMERTFPDVAGTITDEMPLERVLDCLTARTPD